MVAREGNTGMEQEGAKGKRGWYVNPIYSLAFLRTSSSHRWLRNKSVSWYVIQGRIYFTTDWWAEKYHFGTSWKYDEQTVCRPCVCQRWWGLASMVKRSPMDLRLYREDLRWLRAVSNTRREDCLGIKMYIGGKFLIFGWVKLKREYFNNRSNNFAYFNYVFRKKNYINKKLKKFSFWRSQMINI